MSHENYIQFSCNVLFLLNHSWSSFLLVCINLSITKAVCWEPWAFLPETAFSGDTLVHTQGKQKCWSDHPPKKKLAFNNEEEISFMKSPSVVGGHGGMANTTSQGPSARAPGTHGGNVLDNTQYIDHLPSLSHPPSFTGVSWGHLPNKFVLKYSCHGVLLREPRTRQPQIMDWVIPHG